MTAHEFFELLYGTKAPDEYLAISDIGIGGIGIQFFRSIHDDALYEHIIKRNRTRNVYFGVGLLDHVLPYGKRGRKEDIAALPGFWVDIDIEGPGHRKKKLFRTEALAMEVIKKLNLTPSLTIRTGGGLHLYWLFKDLWRLTSEEEQIKADRMSQGFQTAILREARIDGAEIDMTGDITRILRVPDTINKKNDVMCEVLEDSGARYTPEQFLQYENEYPIKLHPRTGIKRREVIVSTETKNFDVHALMDSDADIEASFHRVDSDRFPSNSEADLSLASKLAWLGGEPEDVASAVLGSRSLVDTKAINRPDYVSRTVARAYVGIKHDDEEDPLPPQKIPQELTEEERQGLLKELSDRFGVHIVNIVEYTGTLHSYDVITEHGKFHLGTTEQMATWHTFNTAIMQLEHRTLPTMTQQRWTATLNLLLQAVEMRDTGRTGEDETWLSGYLFDYCRRARIWPHNSDMEYPLVDTEPKIYVRKDERFIHAKAWRAWLKHETRNEDKLVHSALARRMRALGCIPTALACRTQGGQSSFDAWQVPRRIWDVPEEEEYANGKTTYPNGHAPEQEAGTTELLGDETPKTPDEDGEPPF